MAGLSETGLTIRTQPELQTLIEQALDGALPGINLRAGPVQQLVGILSEELAIGWEVLQESHAAQYPDGANGMSLDQLSALTGTDRRAATKSRVTATVNLNAGVTLAVGAIAAVATNPDAQFVSIAAATNSSGVAANIAVVFESLTTGPVAAPAATLSVIVTPVAGWNSITNALDAELGREVALDPELRTQRLVELAGAGQDSYAAIRATVAKIEEILEIQVLGNETLATDGDGRPGKSFEAIVWDGDPAGADDDEIAQAIWDSKPVGILPHGIGSTGNAVDGTGATRAVLFTRAIALRVYVDAVVVLRPNPGTGWQAQAQAAVAARGDLYLVGEDAYASQISCALIEVPAILAVTSVKIEKDDATPDDAIVVTTYKEIVRISSADVDVTT